MGIIVWIILGAIVGFLANMIMGSREGLIGTIILGIIGAFVGGIIASALGFNGVNGLNIESIVFAVIGACIVVAIWRMIVGRSAAEI